MGVKTELSPKHRPKVSKNKALRKALVSQREEFREVGENCVMR
jgi:hypothetical protein